MIRYYKKHKKEKNKKKISKKNKQVTFRILDEFIEIEKKVFVYKSLILFCFGKKYQF